MIYIEEQCNDFFDEGNNNLKKINFNKRIVIRNCILVVLVCVILFFALHHNPSYQDLIEKTRIKTVQSGEEIHDVSMYSGDNIMVINLENTYWMFYEFKDGMVSNLSYYYEYDSKEEAAKMKKEYLNKETLNSLNGEKIEEVLQKGRYVILKPNTASYQSTSRQDVMEMYEVLNNFSQVMAEG